MRDCLKKFKNESIYFKEQGDLKMEIFFDGRSVQLIDAVEIIRILFPYIIIITLSIVIFMTTLVFRSLFVPFRLIFTIVLTLCFSFGSAVIVFQKGLLNWIDQYKDLTRIFWITPVINFSIITGLALGNFF
jgi:uncharacterized membrane protein YdfJ with MMPL/SSD domain